MTLTSSRACMPRKADCILMAASACRCVSSSLTMTSCDVTTTSCAIVASSYDDDSLATVVVLLTVSSANISVVTTRDERMTSAQRILAARAVKTCSVKLAVEIFLSHRRPNAQQILNNYIIHNIIITPIKFVHVVGVSMVITSLINCLVLSSACEYFLKPYHRG